MNVGQTFRVAARALVRNTLRSFLTTLGIVIGVAAVIAMVAIGDGAKAQVESSFAAMGSNLLIVLPGTTTAGGAHGGFGTMPTITWDDLHSIREEVPSVRAAAAVLRSTAQVMSEEQNWTTSVQGTSPEYLEIRSWPLDHGVPFTESDLEGRTKVALLGQTVVTNLYGPNADPVGQTIRIRNIPFLVIGVLEAKGQSPMGQDYDDCVIVPETTFQSTIQGGLQKYINGALLLSAVDAESTARAESQTAALLRDRHHLPQGVDDDFSVRNLAEMASAQQEGTKTLTLLLASIAAVSLLVGGIGVMNIMLVSVTERTREIGLRMAVGAKPRDILAQFLVEALTLSVMGGFLGVVLGLSVAKRLATQFGWPMLVRPEVIVVAVLFSGFVGIGFGLFPASKAARLDPIEALRYE